ncbi:MAG: hypothetical protein HUU10_07525 [Bacteroidetes bacterium]|nr:hypothetical protein [Bacteroidota bacterium]
MAGFLEKIRQWLPPVSDDSRIRDYFQSAWQMEHQNLDLYPLLVPMIRYPFLVEKTTDLQSAQATNSRQIEIELASNQIDRPVRLPAVDLSSLPTDYHKRIFILNILLENNKSLAAIYLHLSYAETIALNTHYEKLKIDKENQIKLLQDICIRLN